MISIHSRFMVIFRAYWDSGDGVILFQGNATHLSQLNASQTNPLCSFKICSPDLSSGQSIGVCDHAPSTSCSAYSSLNIRVTSGSCSGEASANCEVG